MSISLKKIMLVDCSKIKVCSFEHPCGTLLAGTVLPGGLNCYLGFICQGLFYLHFKIFISPYSFLFVIVLPTLTNVSI